MVSFTGTSLDFIGGAAAGAGASEAEKPGAGQTLDCGPSGRRHGLDPLGRGDTAAAAAEPMLTLPAARPETQGCGGSSRSSTPARHGGHGSPRAGDGLLRTAGDDRVQLEPRPPPPPPQPPQHTFVDRSATAASAPLVSEPPHLEDEPHRPAAAAARRRLHVAGDEGRGGLSEEDMRLESAARELQSSILSFLADAETAPAPCHTPLRGPAASRPGGAGFLSDRSTIPATPGEKPTPDAYSKAPLSPLRAETLLVSSANNTAGRVH